MPLSRHRTRRGSTDPARARDLAPEGTGANPSTKDTVFFLKSFPSKRARETAREGVCDQSLTPSTPPIHSQAIVPSQCAGMDAKMQPVGPDGKRPRREPPVFYPTMADMRGSFEKYIESIEEDLEEFGIGRIVPPAGWTPRQEGYDDIDFTVDHPIKQVSARRP